MTPDSALLPWITGAGGAVVAWAFVAWAFYSGKIHSDREFQSAVKERDEYKAALGVERLGLDELGRTGTVTNQLLGALASMAQAKQDEAVQHEAERHHEAGNITAGDLGLR